MFITIELLPLAILLSEAKQSVIASSRKDYLAIRGSIDGSTEFLVHAYFPVFIRLLSLDELLLQLLNVYICLKFLLFLKLLLLLGLILCFGAFVHGCDNIVIDHPDLILVVSCDRLSSVGPVGLVVIVVELCYSVLDLLLSNLLILFKLVGCLL